MLKETHQAILIETEAGNDLSATTIRLSSSGWYSLLARMLGCIFFFSPERDRLQAGEKEESNVSE